MMSTFWLEGIRKDADTKHEVQDVVEKNSDVVTGRTKSRALVINHKQYLSQKNHIRNCLL